MNRSEKACSPGDALETRDLVADRFEIAILELGLRLRRAMLALRRVGKAPHQIADQLGKLLKLAAAAALRSPAKPDMRCGT